MLRKKKAKVGNVQNTRDDTDQVIDQVLKELREEDGIQREIDEAVRMNKKKKKIRNLVVAAAIVVIAVTVFLVIHLQTYTSGRVTATYELPSENASCLEFGDGVLRYSKDGIALVNRKGDEVWNQSYQIKTPIINTYADVAIVIADKGGNTVLVLDKEGLKGEMETTLPIERVAVSGQGIVCAILKDSGAPKIMCYDAKGNSLIEMSTSLIGTGYPLDISLSKDGKTLLVSYLCVENRQMVSKVRYYDFKDEKQKQQDYEVTADDYAGTIAAENFFINDTTSVVVADNRLLFYGGEGAPKLTAEVKIKKRIRSVFHDDKYVGLILKNEGKTGYELCLYDTEGNKAFTQTLASDYANGKICGRQIILYDGKKCSVYTKMGVHKFEGALESNILEIFPVLGVNKYIVMNANGMEVVRFVK